MAYDKFSKIISPAVPLPVENVDTDQIIPARFLKAVERKGFGDNLFRDWRYNKDGTPKKDFPLNNPKYKGKILVAGKNFGSGSSREHAAWSIYDYGFRVVVSSFFADIFKNNAVNNGLLPVVVSPEFLEKIFDTIENNPEAEFEVNLIEQKFTNLTHGESEKFQINPYKKHCLQNGLDDIDYLVAMKDEIASFEAGKVNF
jgi:3-isopropylmalate/(R)-2-methylmalate dehydratase small subunit